MPPALLRTDDTIAAVATAAGAGSVHGMVRVSGPDTRSCLQAIFRAAAAKPLADFRQPQWLAGQLSLDDTLGTVPAEVLLWPSMRSYTRQPAAEVYTIGSPPLLEAVVQAVCRHGARPAEPGEFTLRAFLAGRLDLTQAEAVLAVIDAHSTHQLRVALQQLAGGLATPLHRLRDALLDLLAHLEAGLDFAEEDIQFITPAELLRQIADMDEAISDMIQRMRHRHASDREFRVVLLGQPNAGKSSLLNALVGDGAALVSEQAGTTRDYVNRRLEVSGRGLLLIDTAGVEPATDDNSLSAASQRMTVQQQQQADLRLICIDASRELTEWDRRQLKRAHESDLIVWTKMDLCQTRSLPPAAWSVGTSSQDGRGLGQLRAMIGERLEQQDQQVEVVAGTASRCLDSLHRAVDHLQQARFVIQHQGGEEIVAAELRGALDELGKVVGTVYTDDVLDRIFSRFCIGK